MVRIRGGYRLYILMALILATGLVSEACVLSSGYVRESRELAASGDWDRSVRLLQRAHDKNPADPEIKLMLVRARSNASAQHMVRGEKLLEKELLEEAIKEFQISIAFNPGNVRSEALVKRAKDFRESRFLFHQGRKLLKAGDEIKAGEAFRKAIKLNPENKSVKKALEALRREKKRPPHFNLKLKTGSPVSLKFKKTPITNVFEVLSRLTNINFIFDKDMRETKVTLFMTDVSLDRFLDVLLRTNGLAGKLVDARTMIIYPKSPAKKKEYEDLQIRTFYLSNLSVKKAVGLLAKILKSKDIIANEKLNALVIRGTEELIKIASKIIEANDRPSAEVLLNVEILEVSRTKERQLGLDINPTSITFGVGESSPVISKDSDFSPNVSLHALGRLTNKELLLSIPTATLNLLKQDADTRTLASPQVRVKNGEKATIHVGERVPLRVNRRIDTTGVVTNDFQYQDIGVKVEAAPDVHLNDEISLKLALEVSALGANLGTTDEPQFSIKTRKTNTVLTMRDGEPVIIGGLISDEERQTMRKIPLLGDIPGIGALFSSLDRTKVETDILMAITPIITRTLDIPTRDVSVIWSGKEREFSQRAPFGRYSGERIGNHGHPAGGKGSSKRSTKGRGNPGAGTGRVPLVSPQQEGLQQENPSSLDMPPGQAPESRGKKGLGRPTGLVSRPAEKATNPMLRRKGAGANPSSEPGDEKHRWPPNVRYSIHVSSYANKGEAMNQLEYLNREKYECFLVPVDIPGMGFYFRIFVGGFKDYRSASKTLTKLKGKKGFPSDIHVVDRRWAFGG